MACKPLLMVLFIALVTQPALAYRTDPPAPKVENFEEFLKKQHPDLFTPAFQLGENDLTAITPQLEKDPKKLVELLFYSYRSGPLNSSTEGAKEQLTQFQERLGQWALEWTRKDSAAATAFEQELKKRMLLELNGDNFGYTRQAMRLRGLLRSPDAEVLSATLDRAIRANTDLEAENYFEIAAEGFPSRWELKNGIPKEYVDHVVDRYEELEKSGKLLHDSSTQGEDMGQNFIVFLNSLEDQDIKNSEASLARLVGGTQMIDTKEIVASKLLKSSTDVELQKQARQALTIILVKKDLPQQQLNPIWGKPGEVAAKALVAHDGKDPMIRDLALLVLKDPQYRNAGKMMLAEEMLKINKGDPQALRFMLKASKSEDLSAWLKVMQLYPDNPLPERELIMGIRKLVAEKNFDKVGQLRTALSANGLKIPEKVLDEMDKAAEIMPANRAERFRQDMARLRQELTAPPSNYRRPMRECPVLFSEIPAAPTP